MGPQRRAQYQRQQNSDEGARRAHRDPCSALLRGQILAGELADRAEHYRLRDRDDDLPGHRPGKRLAAEAHQPAERDQRPARGQYRAKPAVEQDPRGDREHHIQQRKDLRQPTNRAHRDPVSPGRFGGDRRVGQPQHLCRCAHQAVGDDHRPAACLSEVVSHICIPIARPSAIAPRPTARLSRILIAATEIWPSSVRRCVSNIQVEKVV